MKRSESIANPAPLGLAGFGFTTVLLNIVNIGLVNGGLETSFVMTMGFFFGGLCQLIAGHWAFKLDEIFPATAFTAYGAFWETLAFWWLLDMAGLTGTPSGGGIAAYMILWGIFTFYMWINSFYHNKNLVIVFGTLWVLFFLLGAHFALESTIILRLAGLVGIICGFWAIWTSFSIIFFEHTGTKLPGMETF
ncbi:hypothetical protein AKJ62_04090 [candidate division MSBL1 archaeon SCGC-AAA259D14]|uniref:Uncharacterized protein n=3 Tax=candidate division MSBL1 TaxID=215777 RepID=A0A133U448_9EURY|nr:hypothetical protein AKJ61_04065 [candidate division MSBL1 archaeon SCGC-AAA259B11]KXA88959.1 hypothetical protein AKJ62_04090 [candidate division MSBL1 archaeon SCGC-AAA259D14]KXA92516.1 hypothetical protein AKJ66_04005 [candidate division MSBL1 archaeon SCGC-AAA259E22]